MLTFDARYSPAVMQRFAAPKYVFAGSGDMHVLAQLRDAAFGDEVRFCVDSAVYADSTNADVIQLGFHCLGAPSTIACAEWLCEQWNLQGINVAQLNVQTLTSHLTSMLDLQPQQHYSAVLVAKSGHQALQLLSTLGE